MTVAISQNLFMICWREVSKTFIDPCDDLVLSEFVTATISLFSDSLCLFLTYSLLACSYVQIEPDYQVSYANVMSNVAAMAHLRIG